MAILGTVSAAVTKSLDQLKLLLISAASLAICFNLIRAAYYCLMHPLGSFPGPRLWSASRIPYIYNLWRGRLHERIKEIHDTYGPVVRIAPDELSFNVDGAWNDIYCGGKANKGLPKHDAYRNAQTFESLFDASDENHSRLRKLLKKDFFSLKAARRQEIIVQQHADRLIAQLRAHHCRKADEDDEKKDEKVLPADLSTWFNWATFDIIGRITLSEDFGCVEGHAYHPWLLMVVTHFKMSAFIMCMRFYPWIPALLLRLAPARLLRLQDTFLSLIRERVDHRRKRTLPPGEQDFVTTALCEGKKKQDDYELGLSADELEANCILLLLAGSDTIATSLLSAAHMICENPAAMRRLTAEVRSVKESAINFDNTTANMPYLNAVLRETHRLCPPLTNGPARVVGPGGAVINGHAVPAGTAVAVTQYAANRSANNFTCPDKFLPERWLSPEQAASYEANGDGWDHDQFSADIREAVRPFSAGGRDCLGQNLAWVEFRVLLARLVWTFDLEVCREGTGHTDVDKQQHKASGILAFQNWTDQQAFMLWQKESYYVWLKDRVVD